MTFSRRLTSMTLYSMMLTHEEESQGQDQEVRISIGLVKTCSDSIEHIPKSGVEGQE